MALINFPNPSNATDKTKALFEQIEKDLGSIPNVLQLYGLSPVILEKMYQEVMYFFQHPSLSVPLLAFVRLSVSTAHNCQYCVTFNKQLLIHKVGMTVEQINAGIENPENAPLNDKEKLMLKFLLKATNEKVKTQAEDINELKQAGWSESDIFEALYHAARNVAVDIIVKGVHLESDY